METKKRRSNLSFLLITFCFIFSGSICIFIIGCWIRTQPDLSIKLLCISFVSGVLSGTGMMFYKFRIDSVIEFGRPIFAAVQHIRDVIEATNLFGVEQLHNLVESAIKGELRKRIEKEQRERGGK